MFNAVTRKNVEFKTLAIKVTTNNIFDIMMHPAITSCFITKVKHDSMSSSGSTFGHNYQLTVKFRRFGSRIDCNHLFGNDIMIVDYMRDTVTGKYLAVSIESINPTTFKQVYDIDLDHGQFTEFTRPNVTFGIVAVQVTPDNINDLINHPVISANYNVKVKSGKKPSYEYQDENRISTNYHLRVKVSRDSDKDIETCAYGNQYLIIAYGRNTEDNGIIMSNVTTINVDEFEEQYEVACLGECSGNCQCHTGGCDCQANHDQPTIEDPTHDNEPVAETWPEVAENALVEDTAAPAEDVQ